MSLMKSQETGVLEAKYRKCFKKEGLFNGVECSLYTWIKEALAALK